MNKSIKNKLIPKFRFPEFDDGRVWDENVLEGIATFVNEKTPLENILINSYISTENLLPDYGGVAVTSKLPTSGNFTKYRKGDVLISNIRPYLKKVWFADKDGACSNDVIALRSNSVVSDAFLSSLLKNDAFINYIMKGAEGVKMPRGDKDSIKEYPVTYPKEKSEQEKIASCLSSLNEVTTAESQKLELLKDHKKGLLQNLFPQEGETVPKFRFKEFEGSGDWEETTLTQVADYENGKAHEQDIADNGEFIVVNSKFISQDGDVKKFTNTAFCPATKGDVLMVLSDIPNGKAIAKCFLVEEDNRYTVNQRICRITTRNLNSKILYYLLNRNPYFLAFDDGVKQTNLRKEDVLNCPLMIPEDPKEQEMIADTLSSIDDLINAQRQKIEDLNNHKKGLLQGLFPDVDEVTI